MKSSRSHLSWLKSTYQISFLTAPRQWERFCRELGPSLSKSDLKWTSPGIHHVPGWQGIATSHEANLWLSHTRPIPRSASTFLSKPFAANRHSAFHQVNYRTKGWKGSPRHHLFRPLGFLAWPRLNHPRQMEIYLVAKDLQRRRFHKPASHPLCCLTTPVRTSLFISSLNLTHGAPSQFLLVSCISLSHTWGSFLRLLPGFSSLGWSIPIPSTSSYKPNFLTGNHRCDFPLNFGIPKDELEMRGVIHFTLGPLLYF